MIIDTAPMKTEAIAEVYQYSHPEPRRTFGHVTLLLHVVKLFDIHFESRLAAQAHPHHQDNRIVCL